MLGHELRNPLAAIRTAAEVAARGGRDDPEMAQEQAEIIQRQSTHMARLVDDLLDVARVTTGKIVLNRRRLDLREIARGSLKSLQLANGSARHQILVKTPNDPVPVDGDPVRLEQIVSNLLTNATRYTPEGGTIWLVVERDGSEAVLKVCDTGDGIPPEILTGVFELFVQSKQPLARSKGGLGIGLSVVRSLVQMHGGRVLAASEGLGKGSEFSVRLPLAEQTAPPIKDTDACSIKGKSRNILVVEDNPDARRAMQRLLKFWGHRVEVAGDGGAGVDKALSIRPDIMLVDIGLPDIDGYEVARRTRQALRDEICLIALTGYGQPEDRERAAAAGFNRHLVKPVAPDQLQRLLAGDLAGAILTRE